MRLLTLVFILSSQMLFAQNSMTDSLLDALKKNPPDSTRVILLGNLSFSYNLSKPDTAMFLAKQGLELAREIKFQRGEAACLNLLGNVYGNTGNYPKALEMYLESLKINERLHYNRGIAIALANIAIIYYNQEDYERDLEYTERSKNIAIANHDTLSLVIAFINIGDSYEKLNKLDSARSYTQQGYELALQLHDINNIGMALNNLGNIHTKMEQDELAMDYYRLAIPYLQEENNLDVLCESALGIAKLYQKKSKYDSALKYARLSLEEARQSGFTLRSLNAANFMAAYFKKKEMPDSAYAYQDIIILAKDSLFNQEKVRQVQNLSFHEQIRQQEIEEENKLRKEERHKNLQLLAIAVFIIIFLGAILLLSKIHIRPRVIEFMSALGLLLLFEFITLFTHPYIAHWTHETPILILIISVLIASVLVPSHHKLEHWMKEKLVHNSGHLLIPVPIPEPTLIASAEDRDEDESEIKSEDPAGKEAK